jgi:ketosteroid isomerase-like protein
MKNIISLILIFAFSSFSVFAQNTKSDENSRLNELNNYWSEVSRAVNEGDFEAYVNTCDTKGVLVEGIGKKAYPLSSALKRWEKEFVDTKSGIRKSSVEFRFSQRLGDGKAAHETGVFRYTFEQDGKKKSDYINFEALLVKDGTWKIMMEYQKSRATKEDWDKLEEL